MDQLGGGEAVVQLDQVEVLGAHAGLLVGLLGGVAGQGVDVGQHLAGLFPGIGGEHRRRHLDRPAPLIRVQGAQLPSVTTTAAAAPSQLAEHMGRVLG